MREAPCAKCHTSPVTETLHGVLLCPSCVKTCSVMVEASMVYLQSRLGELSDEEKESYRQRLLRGALAAHQQGLIIHADANRGSN